MGKRKFDIGDSIRLFRAHKNVFANEKTFVSNVLLTAKRGVVYEVESKTKVYYVKSNEIKLTRLIIFEKIISKLLFARLISEDREQPF